MGDGHPGHGHEKKLEWMHWDVLATALPYNGYRIQPAREWGRRRKGGHLNIYDVIRKMKERRGAEGFPRPVAMPAVRRRWILLLLLLALPLLAIWGGAVFITDLYWFEANGYESVFWRKYIAQWSLFGATFAAAFVLYAVNWRLALRRGAEYAVGVADLALVRLAGELSLVLAAVFAALSGLAAAEGWMDFLKFLNPVPFGETDPLFSRDVGFYVFTLPFVEWLRAWAQGVVFLALMGTGAVYLALCALYFQSRRLFIAPPARKHLSILVAVYLLLWGADYWLSRYDLLRASAGVVWGAGYTEVHVILPALTALAVGMGVAAALFLANAVTPVRRGLFLAAGILLVLGWVARAAVPALVQQYIVKPNEYEREKPYIAWHLDHTRRGFGLDGVKTVPFSPESEVTPMELAQDEDTVRNIRMWDYSPLLRTYRQLQAIRTYYNFSDVYVDRYDIDGTSRQVMVAVRSLDPSNLQNRTWVNTHLEFTHGYGVVMNPVNVIAAGGQPHFFMKDIPVQSEVDIALTRPEIYYGLWRDPYVFVNTNVREFDYPMGDSNVRSTYEEEGGVEIGSLWRRILFALRFRDTGILFTGALIPESRVLYNRNVPAAFREIAPFLTYDMDTYPIIIDGRVKWMQDAFTGSDRYPYSKPFRTNDRTLAHMNGVNYVRNSVKAIADAYTGRMEFYAVDEEDPVIRSWMQIFPGLFRKKSDMSAELWKHARYPEDLFEVQTDVYCTYHMTDTNTYYNREDVWEVTPEGRERRIAPNYVTMRLRGGESAEFAIIVPYMPLGRNNLIGWMAGRCDPGQYGELLVYEFPKQTLIYGPAQVEALIDQNPEISAQLSLWSQRGSDVIRGDLLVIPIGKSLLYVQPLYLKAETGELPELKRVIVSTGGRVAWDEHFGSALTQLMGQRVHLADEEDLPADTAADTMAPADPGRGHMADLIAEAQRLYDASQSAQRSGDWAGYGANIGRLGDVLRELGDMAPEPAP